MSLDLRVSFECDEPFWYVHLHGLLFIEYLNDYTKEYPCDLDELNKSTEHDGIYCLFRCICGDRGCGGTWVEVVHTQDEVIWVQAFKCNGMGELGERLARSGWSIWSFRKVDYISAVRKAIDFQPTALQYYKLTEQDVAPDG